MAMSKGIEREVKKLRELMWHFLEGEKCCFCKQPFLLKDVGKTIQFGDAVAPPMDDLPTIHHGNGNHRDNRKKNRKLAHQKCHKSHHAKLVFAAFRKRMAA